MTLADCRVQVPRAVEAYELHKDGLSYEEIAMEMDGDVSRRTVQSYIALVQRLLSGKASKTPWTDRPQSMEKVVADAPRCKCGLRMPCNDCIPSIDAFATSRRGASSGEVG